MLCSRILKGHILVSLVSLVSWFSITRRELSFSYRYKYYNCLYMCSASFLCTVGNQLTTLTRLTKPRQNCRWPGSTRAIPAPMLG
jgi:hypothetical protein